MVGQQVKPFEERPELGRKVEEVVRLARGMLGDAGWHLPTHLYPEFPNEKIVDSVGDIQRGRQKDFTIENEKLEMNHCSFPDQFKP